jgi:hypothetical protein
MAVFRLWRESDGKYFDQEASNALDALGAFGALLGLRLNRRGAGETRFTLSTIIPGIPWKAGDGSEVWGVPKLG